MTNYNYYGTLLINDSKYTDLYSNNIGSIKLNLDKLGKTKIKIENRENLNNIFLYYLNKDAYDKAISELKKYELKNIKMKRNVLKGDINLDKDGIILLTIPYDKGWQIYVDGEKVKYYKVANEFIGIKVSLGKHKIYMKYYPRGLALGIIISISTLIVSIILINRKNKYHNN